MALTVEDADAIVGGRAQAPDLHGGSRAALLAEYVELQRRVRAGGLGRPLAVSAYRLSPPADWAAWYADVSQSGGPPVDLMVHDFDQMNWLFGTPRTVYARAVSLGDPAYPNHVVAVVEYEGGAEAVVEGSMAMPASFPSRAPFGSSARTAPRSTRSGPAPAEAGGNIGAADPSARGLRLYPHGGEPEVVLLDPVDPWGPEIEEFVSCLEQGRQPENGTGEQARLGLRVSLAAAGRCAADARRRS